MPILTIDLEGQGQFKAAVFRWDAIISDIGIVFPAIGQAIRDAVDENFETQGQRLAGGWADLSTRYADRKQKRWGFVTPIMVASGRLFQSLVLAGNPEHVERTTSKTAAEFGTTVPYAGFHQDGEGVDRVLLSFDEQLSEEIVDIMADALRGVARLGVSLPLEAR